MNDTNIHIDCCCKSRCQTLEIILEKLSQLADQLTAIDAKLTEASTEIPDEAMSLLSDIENSDNLLADIVPN